MAGDPCAQRVLNVKLTTITEIQQKVEQQQIKGFLADDEAAALYTWMHEVGRLGPGLEVGSYCGKSTIYLGCACKARDGVLYAVDHHRGSEEHQLGEQYHDPELYNADTQMVDSFPIFRRNIDRFGLADTVVPIVASSRLSVKGWATPLALVFIDGGHSHEAARADCLSWSRHLLAGGVLAIHDVFAHPEDGGQGPYLGMQAVLEQGGFEWLQTVNSLAILRRR